MQFEWLRNYPNFQGHSAAIDSLGNIYSVGDSSRYLIVLKHNPNGNLIWKRKLNYVKSNSPILVATDKNNDLYVSCGNIAHNYVLTKIDSFGQLKWENILIYGGYDEPYSIAVDKAGYIYLTGRTFNGITKCLTVKYTPQGDTLWARINPEYVMGGNYVSLDDSGYVYVAGNYITSEGGYYYGTLKYDNNGNLKWFSKYRYHQNTISYGLCVKPDNKGNCYVSGYIRLYSGNFISGLIKYDYKGDSVWVRIFGDSLTYTSGSTNINFDDIGNIYLSSIYTLKYDTTGYLNWHIYNDSYSTSFAYHNNRLYFAGTSLWQGPDSLRIFERDEKGKLISQNYYPKSPSKLDLKFYNNSFYLIINSQDSLILMKFRTSPNSIVNNTTIVSDYKLHQNIPNPFNPSSVIRFQLPVVSNVVLKVYDAMGREVQTLVNENLNSGTYSVEFNGEGLSSGVYFYKIDVRSSGSSTGKFTDVKRMVLLK